MDMKSLDNCNIAVCLMGQSRTFENCSESINNFFSSRRGNNFHFFGHTWDTNTYKIRKSGSIIMVNEKIDNKINLENNLQNHFNFKDLVVEEDIYRPYPWANMFYSTMRSNFLKQKYEVENNMMFDLVVKARYDVCYRDGTFFEDTLSCIQEKTLYSFYGIMHGEFFLPNPDDVIYCGSSLTMDLVDSLYNGLSTGTFNKIMGTSNDNPLYNRVGPGILIHKWASIKNILHSNFDNGISYAVRRKESEKLNYKTYWEELYKIGQMIV